MYAIRSYYVDSMIKGTVLENYVKVEQDKIKEEIDKITPLINVITSYSIHYTKLYESGQLQYIHDGTENFADTFTYTITDGEFIDTATVSVTITPVNDPPVAVDDFASVAEAGTVSVDVLANDTDTDSIPTIANFTQPAYGTVSEVSGQLQYISYNFV